MAFLFTFGYLNTVPVFSLNHRPNDGDEGSTPNSNYCNQILIPQPNRAVLRSNQLLYPPKNWCRHDIWIYWPFQNLSLGGFLADCGCWNFKSIRGQAVRSVYHHISTNQDICGDNFQVEVFYIFRFRVAVISRLVPVTNKISSHKNPCWKI